MVQEKLKTQVKTGGTIIERVDAISKIAHKTEVHPFIQTLKHAAHYDTEASPAVRMHALKAIHRHPEIIDYDPKIMFFLTQIFSYDKNRNVQREAGETLVSFFPEMKRNMQVPLDALYQEEQAAIHRAHFYTIKKAPQNTLGTDCRGAFNVTGMAVEQAITPLPDIGETPYDYRPDAPDTINFPTREVE